MIVFQKQTSHQFNTYLSNLNKRQLKSAEDNHDRDYIVICLMKKECGVRQMKQIEGTGTDFYNEEVAMSQIELEEKCIHLQTVLMLTQLNSAYFEMRLSLHRVFSTIEEKYFSRKMTAFLRMCTQKRNVYEGRHRLRYNNLAKDQQQNERNSEMRSRIKPILILEDEQARKYGVFLKTAITLEKFVNNLQEKKATLRCSAFYQILTYQRQPYLLRIFSEKHSRIQANDRSKDRRDHRRLFSLQKSKANYKGEQRQTPQQSIIHEKQEFKSKNMNELNRLLVKNIEPPERRGRLQRTKSRKTFRSISRHKQNKSTIGDRKQQKLIQLLFLRQKYDRLITQFNSFSDNFLRVIEQQQAK